MVRHFSLPWQHMGMGTPLVFYSLPFLFLFLVTGSRLPPSHASTESISSQRPTMEHLTWMIRFAPTYHVASPIWRGVKAHWRWSPTASARQHWYQDDQTGSSNGDNSNSYIFFPCSKREASILCTWQYYSEGKAKQPRHWEKKKKKKPFGSVLLNWRFQDKKKKFASEVVVALRKAGLSVPRRELAAAGLADESVSVFGLWYLVDVHHLDCPLLFGCAKKSKHKKGKRLTSMKKTADFHQYDKTVDLASYCLTCYSSLQKGPFQIHQRFQTFIVMF
jgi:hypothetical protein